jgi:GNAT superfamily N-acetyltransferase
VKSLLITEVSEPEKADYAIIKTGLDGFNEIYTGSLLNEELSSFAKNANNSTVGGILGEINWGWLYVKGLWVSESYRSKGIASMLLHKLEDYALSKGVGNFRLETTSFQALGFYEKKGYILLGQLPDMPPTFTSYFLKKQSRL